TCATPFEAEVMADVADDILVAYPPLGSHRADRLASLSESTRLVVALDSLAAVEDLARAAVHADRPIGVYVELDVGMHRVGLPDVKAAIEVARAVRARPPLEFAGIAFYPGHIREPVEEQNAKLASLDAWLRSAVEAFDRAGLRPPVVSGGSTPTMWRTHELTAVTEFRPGTYVYNDRSTAVIGACEWEDCALTVLATVISTAVPDQAVIDAGTKSLGREPIREPHAGDGFGAIAEHPEVIVKSMSEEHGILDLSATSWKPEVGERVRVLPNHVCVVVHLNDGIAGVRGEVVEIVWRVAALGRGDSIA